MSGRETPKLICSAWLDDWFVIAPYRGGGQPEGSVEDWRAILDAMKGRRAESFRRVAVWFDPQDNAHFYSPRNSSDDDAAIVQAAAVDETIERYTKILDVYQECSG